ncbi:hypothetical protein [Anaerosporobacter sp.]|uniref:hypothetical protein n=1 Tax=Anaerosporobacter sp. TaxID=1872529 RepID=UPI00286F4425|nr:hypothetical protein [Anaerosporobacter sp.]
MTMISQVFTQKGQTESISVAYGSLIKLNPADKYSKQKAAGSLGGASRWGYIDLLPGGKWMRVR